MYLLTSKTNNLKMSDLTAPNREIAKFWADFESGELFRTAADSVSASGEESMADRIKPLLLAAIPNGSVVIESTQMENAINKIARFLAKCGIANHSEHDAKDAESMQKMALAAGLRAGLSVEAEGNDVILYSALVLILLIRNDDDTRQLQIFHSNEEFLGMFTSSDFKDLTEGETTALRRFANCINISKSIISAKQNKERLMKIASCLSEGLVYITGSGQSPATTRRVLIFERLTGTSKVYYSGYIRVQSDILRCEYFIAKLLCCSLFFDVKLGIQNQKRKLVPAPDADPILQDTQITNFDAVLGAAPVVDCSIGKKSKFDSYSHSSAVLGGYLGVSDFCGIDSLSQTAIDMLNQNSACDVDLLDRSYGVGPVGVSSLTGPEMRWGPSSVRQN